MKNKDIKKVENLKITDNDYIIRWNVTRLCNYYCDFCIQGNKQKHLKESKGENKELRNEICDKIIDFIENKLNGKYNKLYIELIGGEVTILPDFYEILEKLYTVKFEGKIKIKIKTNLSFGKKMIKKIKKLTEYNTQRKIIIGASYYKNYTTERKFIKKVKALSSYKYKDNFKLKKTKKRNKKMNDLLIKLKLKENPTNVSVYVVYPLINDQDYQKYLKFLKKYQKQVEKINYIVIRDYKESISDELKKELSKKEINEKMKVTLKNNKCKYFLNTTQIENILEEKHFNTYNYECDAGVQSICIDNLGLTTRCPEYNGQNLTKIPFDLNNKKIKCPYDECHCGYYRTLINTVFKSKEKTKK